jgi:hypothetical protein
MTEWTEGTLSRLRRDRETYPSEESSEEYDDVEDGLSSSEEDEGDDENLGVRRE